MSSSSPSGLVQKHRACDECRTRKLACTKEPDGCSRCKREGISCHYSAQKPMGRPRKRPREDEEDKPNATAALPPTKMPMSELPPDTADPGMEFLNLLFGDEFNFSQPPLQIPVMSEPTTQSMPDSWGFAANFGDLNFDPIPAEPSSFSTANIDPALFTTPTPKDAPVADLVPALSPNSNNASSPESTSVSTPSNPYGCRCTTELSSALDLVKRMPTEVEPAIRQARLAAKTAYEAVVCPVCSAMMEMPANGSPSMLHHFQNLMLLATLIPSLVAAYSQILTKVDDEAIKAANERRQIIFKLSGLGGIWGGLNGQDQQRDLCGLTETYENREMEPRMWRLTVRALLKVDVYGISGSCVPAAAGEDRGNKTKDPFHLGLKDIVLMMEAKSKARHALLDTLVEAGVWQVPNCSYLAPNKQGELPQCQRIISIARASVEQIVIA
ncbi:hypothetical protein F5Y16DRAFT_4618 [Xylariaceae sp. FL0255]|nr:hypothetical protein F5Y16DRAFT_4618 [Xylariaceae sp. FL0255]